METEPEPDIPAQVDGICERFDAAYFAMMRRIIDEMHKQNDIIQT